MHDGLVSQFQMISNELEHEEDRELEQLISSLAESFDKQQNLSLATSHTSDADFKIHRRRCETKFALLIFRIAVNCQMIAQGYCDYQEYLKQDIPDALEQAESIEYKWEIDDAVISDILEVALALCSSCGDILKSYFVKQHPAFQQYDGEITADLYHLFHVTANYYIEHDWNEYAVPLLEYLCTISRSRNHVERHRELVSRVCLQLGEEADKAICRIGAANEKCFEDVTDEYAGNFFWFYACSLRKSGKKMLARECFDKCYQIRKNLYGEKDWYTAIAKRECIITSQKNSFSESERKDLLSFIDDIENGLYEEIDPYLSVAIEGKTLFILLQGQVNDRKTQKYEHYLNLFEHICDKYNDTDEPALKIRLAKNLRGRYWFEHGDYIQAELAFLEALDAHVPPETSEILTEAQIKSNLLMIYYVQNDVEMAKPILSELLHIIDKDTDELELFQKDVYRICALIVSFEMQQMMELNTEERKDLKGFVEDACKDVQEHKSDIAEWKEELAAFLVCAVMQLVQNDCLSEEEQKRYLTVLDQIAKDTDFFKLDGTKRIFLLFVMLLLAWKLDVPMAEFYIRNIQKLSERNDIPKSTRAAIFQTLAEYFEKIGEYDQAVSYIRCSLWELTSIWQSYVHYLNDERLIQILTPTQNSFYGSYAIIREHVDIEKAYETILQFKALASLAGRERNRILSSNQNDKIMLDSIKGLQDKIALLEMEQMLRDVADELADEKKKLRNLEAEFARKFPNDNLFINISWKEVEKAVPDNSVIIEYFWCVLDYSARKVEKQGENVDNTGIDIYVVNKIDGRCHIKRVTISDGQTILNDACEFVKILQAESGGTADMEQVYKKDDVRDRLYQALIAPILPYITASKILYIAPDVGLVNLPFEILFGDDSKRLGDVYDVVKIECARDFLFRKIGCISEKENLIIGNPQYEITKEKLGGINKKDTGKRSISIRNVDDINQLPFSELEVRLIGRHSKSMYYSGADATKKLILSAEGYKNIHIATHGYFDLEDEGKTVYSSCLLFSGVKNWIKTGEVSETYGNGIVTADEISRLDLSSVELVVLSSCLSGMSEDMSGKAFYGMIGALSAAGVHYVISHLWSADDFCTAVLMDAFYYLYMKKKLDPPEALRLAKQYLRNVTVEHLRKRKWFSAIKNYMADPHGKKILQEYEGYDDQIRPFRGETYWGGFLCYCCN